MKRSMLIVLVLALLVSGATALAWELPWEGGWLIDGEGQAIDLDGDGRAETVWLETVPDDFESFQRLRVMTADGAEAAFDAEIIAGDVGWAGDMDGDGLVEIFLWGDVMSDDYYTWCLHFRDGRLSPVLFADISRGENGRGYFKSGYGKLVGADLEAGTVTLSGSQDLLGTYFMERTLKLSPDGLFETADDGLWVRDLPMDDAMWDSRDALTVKTAIPCEIDGQAAILEPGERIAITATDKQTVAGFITLDGRSGRLAVSENYERGFGSLVDGVPEEDLFESLPYAD